MITPEGDYLSNLSAPDLRTYFKHLHWRVMPHSMGHLVASDWADKADDDPVFGLYKKCGLWTRDEAAVLYAVAEACGGEWVDIGAHSGWTSAHIAVAHSSVDAVDPMLRLQGFAERFEENMEPWWTFLDEYYGKTSEDFFAFPKVGKYRGFCVDGDHSEGKPLEDAQNSVEHLADTGVIIFHDFIGRPVREAVTWLMDQGFMARVYYTPHMVAVCWRGDFTPPDHQRDERINWRPHQAAMAKDFDFSRLD
jgi:hypothetical protein